MNNVPMEAKRKGGEEEEGRQRRASSALGCVEPVRPPPPSPSGQHGSGVTGSFNLYVLLPHSRPPSTLLVPAVVATYVECCTVVVGAS